MDLFPLIENARPHLKKNSIDNYIRNINILHDRKPYDNLDWLKDTKVIEEKLKSKKSTSRRNYIVSVVVALQSADKEKYKDTIDAYQAILKELTTDINSNYEKNEKTEKESSNWLNYSELVEIQKDYKAKVDEMQLNKKTIINPKDNKVLLYYLISSLYTLNNPLRLDWATLKVITNKKDLNETENFLLKTRSVPTKPPLVDDDSTHQGNQQLLKAAVSEAGSNNGYADESSSAYAPSASACALVISVTMAALAN